MYISTFAFFGTFPFLFFILSLALPEADGLGKSKSGESFDDISEHTYFSCYLQLAKY